MNKPRKQPKSKDQELMEPIGVSFEQQVETEIAFLGSFIKLEGDRLAVDLRWKAMTMVRPDDFVGPEHGKIFAMIQDMLEQNEPILVTTLRSRMIHAKFYEKFGGGAALSNLLTEGTSWPIKPAEDIRYFAARRKLQQAAQNALKACENTTNANKDIACYLQQEIDRFQTDIGYQFRSVADIAQDIAKQLDNPPRPLVTTGLNKFDLNCGGFAPGELIVLAARTSIGKSAMACQIAEHAANQFGPVLFITLEMQADDIVRRIISREAVVSVKQIRSGNMTETQKRDVLTATANCNQSRLFPQYMPTAKIRDITTIAKAFKAENGIAMLVVDYLQVITKSDHRLTQREAVGQSTMALKQLAGELDCPVLVLSQFNREATKQQTPTLANLSESGSIENDSDMVIAIHRKCPQDIDAELLILKNRNGETVDLTGLRWCGGSMQFKFLESGKDWQP